MKSVIITYDPAKREATLRARGLDFEAAAQVFAGLRFTRRDERFAYGEDRYITLGLLHGQSWLWSGHPGTEAGGSSQ